MELPEFKYTWDSPFLRSRKSFSRLSPVWNSKTSITNAEDLANVEKILKSLPLNRVLDNDSILKENLTDHLVDLLRISMTAVNPDTKRTASTIMKRLSVSFTWQSMTLFQTKGVELPEPIYRSPSGLISNDQAAAELRCTYLVYLFARKFILYGGKNSWLLDPQLAPDKLKRLSSLNWLLAHQPWNITKKDMESLSLSVSELVFAICLMAHVHALSCFVFATGVRPEIDHPGGSSHTLVDRIRSKSLRSEANGYNRRKSGTLGARELAASEFLKLLSHGAGDSAEEDMASDRVFMDVIRENCDLDKKDPPEWSSRLNFLLDEQDVHPVLHRFLAFNAERPTGYSSFVGAPYQVQTFPWDNDVQAEINQLYEELGNHIGRNFSQAINLTYHT
ncbi:Sestrin-2 [Cichlidogyrus casuarinus]|uniref:Sestrin-2 n=1 Tax=Cichlidogyrus casuarinus TaxID=1844966 RepID=A0ABD2QB03_9PLAT